MKNKSIILIIVIALIIISIILLQKTKPIKNEKPEINKISIQDNSERVKIKLDKYSRAIELVEPNGYLNTDNITISENIGKKVILVDFWTYTCINCQRTIPYLNSWYEKYKDKGLVIIGVHTPEFDFEKDYSNVQKAIEKYNIKYPVVQDNEYKTWTAFNNRFWPRKYLIDIDGFIVYDHIGEGSYKETEEKILELLKERNQVLNLNLNFDSNLENQEQEINQINFGLTPEIYFGYSYSRNQIGNKEGWIPNEIVTYKIPEKIDNDKFYLSGEWLNNVDNMELKGNFGSILLKYSAKEVNIVAGSEKPIEITIFIDGKETKKLEISDNTLYNIVSSSKSETHTLRIEVSEPGIKAYTFTFG